MWKNEADIQTLGTKVLGSCCSGSLCKNLDPCVTMWVFVSVHTLQKLILSAPPSHLSTAGEQISGETEGQRKPKREIEQDWVDYRDKGNSG